MARRRENRAWRGFRMSGSIFHEFRESAGEPAGTQGNMLPLQLDTHEEARRLVVAAGKVARLPLVAGAGGQPRVTVEPPGEGRLAAEDQIVPAAGIVAIGRTEGEAAGEV